MFKSKWEPQHFQLETTSVWSFPYHGSWATHDSNYRGNCSPYIPRNIILRYSKEKDIVLDCFAGGGTTLVEAKLLNRNSIGVDVNETALRRCKEKCNFALPNTGLVKLYRGDARKLNFLPNDSIDLICTHPPYANIISYSKDIANDLSRMTVSQFLTEIKLVAAECHRVMKKHKFCAVLMGDIRKNGYVIPLSFYVMEAFLSQQFKLKELIIKEQHNCKKTDYWMNKSKMYQFLLLAHEHLFVFQK